MTTSYSSRIIPTTNYSSRTWISFIMTELLDFLMTEDNDYIITDDSIYSTYAWRNSVNTTYIWRPTI